MQKDIRLYIWNHCPYCRGAKRLLDEKNLQYQEIDIFRDDEMRKKLQDETSHYTVPYIFIGDQFIGGFSELRALDESGKLTEMLK
ncbi:glutaredoxin domain-containing protein [Eubacteriaceae bacterium ES2]|nr:glutaredoxin domain-containing protein [Eubacteriaceae bacterium ES2]